MTKEQKERILSLSQKAPLDFIILCIKEISESIPKIKESFITQLPLEYLIVKLTRDTEAENVSIQTSAPCPSSPEPEKPLKKNISPKNEPKIPLVKETASKKRETAEPIGQKEESIQVKPLNQEINIYEIETKWKEVIDELGKENCSLSMMLSNSKPIESAQKGLVSIVIRHAFQKDLINKPENRLTIADISNKITGLRFRVEALTEEESGVKLKKILPDINQEMIDKECGLNGSQESLLSDAMTLMGGKIVTNK